MTIAAPPAADLWTYERYMDTPIQGRFEIVEGEMIRMPAPVLLHQIYSGNLLFEFKLYQHTAKNGHAIAAPSDILIRRRPRLRTRQPDLFYISLKRLAEGGGIPKKGPLEAAPELVVEIISDSETESMLDGKTQDYIEIGVLEMWRIWPETRTVEVLKLSPTGAEVIKSYTENETIVSLTFPDLQVPIAALFAVQP